VTYNVFHNSVCQPDVVLIFCDG